MASLKHTLEIMQQCFPEWTDARKRPQKSNSGNWLISVAKESDLIQEAIIEYQKTFFLLNYKNHENEIIDYLYIGLVGDHADLAITAFNCKITTDTDEFYAHRDEFCLYQSPIIFFHEDLLNKNSIDLTVETVALEYSAGDNLYKIYLNKEHIWNVFDEFAKFAGLSRYNNETNKELSTRTYNVFAQFPNPTEQGLKNAIINSVSGEIEILPEEIKILPFNSPEIDYSLSEYETIYEDFLNYNKDVFRAKVWDKSYWENSFQKTGYIPHPWNESLIATQNGVGCLDDLHVDFIKNIGKDTTNVTVNTYKKSFDTIMDYVSKNKLTVDIPLTLTKYSNEINPINVEYKINAYSLQKIDPYSIFLTTKRSRYGRNSIFLDDIVTYTENVTKINRNELISDTNYRLLFSPFQPMGSMEIKKCSLLWKDGEKDLRTEKNNYLFKNGSLINSDVAIHLTSISSADYIKNMQDTLDGITISSDKAEGTIGIDITDMNGKLIDYDVVCNQIEITGNSEIKSYGDFVYNANTNSYIDESPNANGSLIMDLYCNSYSFVFATNSEPELQGSIQVTTVIDGTSTNKIYTEPTVITDDFSEAKNVKIIIKKIGKNIAEIKSVKICAYKVETSLKYGNLIETSMYKMLPEFEGHNMLYIKITPLTASYPILKYLHIGYSLQGASYNIDFNTNDLIEPVLNIRSNCRVSLYKLENESLTLINDNYETHSLYKNDTTERGIIELNMEDFINITSSIPSISERYTNGKLRQYINLAPNEFVDKIDIIGDTLITITSKPLSTIICPDKNAEYEVYATHKNLHAIIVKNKTTNHTLLTGVPWQTIGETTDIFQISGLPDLIEADYIYNDPSEQLTHFDKLSLYFKNSKEYVAYNNINLIHQQQDNIPIVNSFAPSLSLTENFLYVIENPLNSVNNVSFMDDRKWSLGVQNLAITCDIDIMKAKAYKVTVVYINNSYQLSNTIPLERSIILDNTEHRFREYLITPPENMDVDYIEEIIFEDTLIDNTTSYYKLSCSNIKDVVIIVNNQIYTYGFTLLKDEGIVVFTDDIFLGKNLRFRYTVLSPVSLRYKNWQDLYDISNYKTESYAKGNQYSFYNLADGDKCVLEDISETDIDTKIIASTDNSAFQVIVQGNTIQVLKIGDNEQLAIHSGYIYDDGREYYRFSNKFEEEASQLKNMTLHNVTRQGNTFLTHTESINYLPYSNMDGNIIRKSCDIDLIKYDKLGGNLFNHLTACDTYGNWHTINMVANIVPNGKNAYGIEFIANDEVGYAIIEITNILIPGNIISLWQNGNLKIAMVNEALAESLPLHKSIFIYLKNAIELQQYGEYFYHVITEQDKRENTKTYLIVFGNHGIIDDITATPFTTIEDIELTHVKTITDLGFNIQEKIASNVIIPLDFNINYASYIDAMIDPVTKEISTSSNVEYGLTKINEVDINNCNVAGVEKLQNNLVFRHNTGFIRTPSIYIPHNNSVYRLYIKINDLITEQYENFTVKIYGSNSRETGFTFLTEVQNTNFIILKQGNVPAYIYLDIYNKIGSIVQSIEIYARYAETNTSRILVANKYRQCSIVSQLYDLNVNANYIVANIDAKINGNPNKVKHYVRGCRIDSKNMIFTDWKEIKLNQTILENYKFLQFKTDINDMNTSVVLNGFKVKIQ